MIEVPARFAHNRIANDGQGGREWIAALPGLVDELLERWSCVPDGAVMHGEVGIVVPVRHRDLPPAVIKVSFPEWGDVHEPDAFEVWKGFGAVQLYARDDDRFAMLLERAHGTLAEVADPEEAIAIQGELTRRLAVEAPAGLPRMADQASQWEQEIRTAAAALGEPLPRRVVDAAIATVRELGPDQPNTLVHGDLHDANVLASDREPWLVIDPKIAVGDPAFDALNVIRSPRSAPLFAAENPRPAILRQLDIYCTAADLDRDRVRRWTQVGAVREALWGRQHDDPAALIDATDELAELLVP